MNLNAGVIIIYVIAYFSLFLTVLFFLIFFENIKGLKNPAIKDPKKLLKVTVLIPVLNNPEGVRKSLDSLKKVDYPKNKIEVIVINDGSTDNTASVLREYTPWIKIITNKKNIGKGNSLNKALKIATGDVIGCLDSDAFVMRNTLKKMIGYFQNPKVMAVAPSIKIYGARSILGRVQYIEFLSSSYVRKIGAFLGAIPLAPGCFTLFRKKFFDMYGGWDASTITEDVELSLRVESKRYLIENAMDGNVYTKPVKGFGSLLSQRLRWYRGLIDNLKKYKFLFSRAYGNLGLFALPSAIGVVVVTLLATIYSSVLFGENAFNFISDLIVFKFDLGALLDIKLDPFFINTTTPVIFAVLIVILGLYVIFLAKKYSKERQPTKYSLLFFVLLYSFLFSFWWIMAIIYKLSGKKIVWGGRAG